MSSASCQSFFSSSSAWNDSAPIGLRSVGAQAGNRDKENRSTEERDLRLAMESSGGMGSPFYCLLRLKSINIRQSGPRGSTEAGDRPKTFDILISDGRSRGKARPQARRQARSLAAAARGLPDARQGGQGDLRRQGEERARTGARLFSRRRGALADRIPDAPRRGYRDAAHQQRKRSADSRKQS